MTTLDIQKLYIAYFGRPADPKGLEYWINQNISMGKMAEVFGASIEFKALHPAITNTDFIGGLYHDLFGRAGDPPGVAFWSGMVDNGVLSRSNVVMYLLLGAQDTDAQVLSNKLAASLFWTLQTPTGVIDFSDTHQQAEVVRAWLELVTDDASVTTARAGIKTWMDRAYQAGNSTSLLATGQVTGSGYLQDATVFIDLNGNCMADPTELQTRTDAYGHYSMFDQRVYADTPTPANSHVINHLTVTGGFDLGTLRTHTGTLSVSIPQTYKADIAQFTAAKASINALTTMQDALVTSGQSTLAAQARMAIAFEVAPAMLGADVLATLFDAAPGAGAGQISATAALALKAQAGATQIDGVLSIVAKALFALTHPATTPVSDLPTGPTLTMTQAMQSARAGLASELAASTGAFHLDDSAVVLKVLAAAASNSSIFTGGTPIVPGTISFNASDALNALSSASKNAFGSMVAQAAASAGTIDDSGGVYMALAHMLQVRGVMSDLSLELPVRLAQDKASELLYKYSGSALTLAIAAVPINEIDPATKIDFSAIVRTNGSASTLDMHTVEQLYIALFDRPAGIAALTDGMHQSNVHNLAFSLINSAEYKAAHANQSEADALNQIYVNLFGRQGDTDGLAFWNTIVQGRKLTFADATLAIINGASGSDALILHDKAVAASEFSASLSTPALVSQFAGANALSSTWLNTVISDATLGSALDGLPGLMYNTVVSPSPTGEQPVILTGMSPMEMFA